MRIDCSPPLGVESSSHSSHWGRSRLQFRGGCQWLQRLVVCELWEVGFQEDVYSLEIGMVGGQGPLLMAGGSVV